MAEELTDFELMREVMDDWDGEVYDRDAPLEQVLQDFYANQLDDLHDARGDEEYQRGNLERMAMIERWIDALKHFVRYTQAEKDEAGATGPDTPSDNSDDYPEYLDPNPDAQ